MYTNLLTLASLCVVVFAQPGQQAEKRQDADISAIAASLSSLSSALVINPTIAAELTGVPSSVLALQSNAAGISQLASEFLNSGVPAWYSSLSSDAKSYVLEDAAARESLLDGVYSLESLLSAATATVTAAPVTTGIINGTTAALVPAGTGALTLASSTGGGGNSTVTTKKLSSTVGGETKSTGEATTKTAAGKTSEPSPITSSSKAGAAQVTGVVGLGVVGLVGLVWAL